MQCRSGSDLVRISEAAAPGGPFPQILGKKRAIDEHSCSAPLTTGGGQAKFDNFSQKSPKSRHFTPPAAERPQVRYTAKSRLLCCATWTY